MRACVRACVYYIAIFRALVIETTESDEPVIAGKYIKKSLQLVKVIVIIRVRLKKKQKQNKGRNEMKKGLSRKQARNILRYDGQGSYDPETRLGKAVMFFRENYHQFHDMNTQEERISYLVWSVKKQKKGTK